MEPYLHTPVRHYDVHKNNFTLYFVYFLNIISLLFFKYFGGYRMKKKEMSVTYDMQGRKGIGFWWEYLDTDGRVILKWILKKYNGRL
jgi:hypothetical protein